MADTVIIGAGINGLVAATTLARRGRRVVVVERRDEPGGLAASSAIDKAHRTAGIAGHAAHLAPAVIEHLGLAEHGLKDAPPAGVLVAQRDVPGLVLADDVAATAREIAAHSERDAAAYPEFRAFLDRVRPVLLDLLTAAPPKWPGGRFDDWWRLGMQGLALRRLGSRDMIDLLRAMPMTLSDWLGEWFETEIVRPALAGPAIYGTYLGPRSAGGVFNLLIDDALEGRAVAGGPAAVVAALVAAARGAGVELRCQSEVTRIVVEGGRVQGVELAGGERLTTSTIAASCDPLTTFLKLVPPAALDDAFAQRISQYRMRGTTAVLHLALSAPPSLKCRPDHTVVRARIGERLDDLERAFDAVKYDAFSSSPVFDITVPSIHGNGFAPEGHSVATIGVHFAPHTLEGGWTKDNRGRLHDSVMAVLEDHCPGLRSSVVAHDLLTPQDLEERYALTGGHIHHGEHAIDQRLVRPAPQCMRYHTPIKGLFLCGRGSHPGGETTGLPGLLAARMMLA